MLTKQQTEIFLKKLDPMERVLKYAHEHGEIIVDASKATHLSEEQIVHTHMTHLDYSLENGKNLCIIRHNRYAPAQMHDHEFIELSYVFSGKCHHDFLTGEESNAAKTPLPEHSSSVDMSEGELVIIPPGMAHQIAVYDESVIINILVNRNTFQSVFLQNLPSGNLLYQFFWKMIFSEEESSYLIFKKTDQSQLRDYILQLVMEYLEDAPYGPQVCEHLLGILFLKLMESAKETSLSPHLPKGAEQIAPMILYIQKNYKQLTLEELASEFHYSRANINNVFKKYTGTTIRQYTKKLRLQKAEQLLQNTRFSVEEVAMEVGYNDISYFIEQFKAHYGMTPLQYRKKQ